jgi:hypothetical protein
MVGRFKCLESIDLIDNKILDNSPPEAILNNGAYFIPLLAENKTLISSYPNLLNLSS